MRKTDRCWTIFRPQKEVHPDRELIFPQLFSNISNCVCCCWFISIQLRHEVEYGVCYCVFKGFVFRLSSSEISCDFLDYLSRVFEDPCNLLGGVTAKSSCIICKSVFTWTSTWSESQDSLNLSRLLWSQTPFHLHLFIPVKSPLYFVQDMVSVIWGSIDTVCARRRGWTRL